MEEELNEVYEPSYKEIQKEKIIEKFTEFIIANPTLLPEFLTIIGRELEVFRDRCKKNNDSLLREALGDACHILGMKNKPSLSIMRKFCIRIQKAIFPRGIEHYHHEGEKNFYNKYFEDKKET